MTKTFTVGSGLVRDRIRLMIGDWRTGAMVLDDETIAEVLTEQTIKTFAAAACADMLYAWWAGQASDVSIGKTHIVKKQMDYLEKLAERLRQNPGDLPGGDGSGALPAEMHVGGITIDEIEDLRDDSDKIQPTFSVGMDDHPETRDPTLDRWDWRGTD